MWLPGDELQKPDDELQKPGDELRNHSRIVENETHCSSVLCVPVEFCSLSLSLSLSLYMYFVCLRYSSRSLSLSLPLSLLSLDVFVCLISPRSFGIHKCPRKIVLALCAACVLRLQVVV